MLAKGVGGVSRILAASLVIAGAVTLLIPGESAGLLAAAVASLAIIAVWLLIMQWFDIHWQAMPVLHPDQAQFHWLDLSCWIGLLCVFIAGFLWRLSRHSIVCEGDPQLGKSLHFENA